MLLQQGVSACRVTRGQADAALTGGGKRNWNRNAHYPRVTPSPLTVVLGRPGEDPWLTLAPGNGRPRREGAESVMPLLLGQNIPTEERLKGRAALKGGGGETSDKGESERRGRRHRPCPPCCDVKPHLS